MSVPPLSNTYEGGTNGTTITQGVGGNTGGASGNFFDTVTIGAGVGLTFSNTLARGTLSAKTVQAATGQPTSMQWSGLGSFTTDVWTRWYFNVSTVSVADIHCVYGTSIGASVVYAGFSAASKVQITDGAGSSIAALLGATILSINTWYRLEVRVIPSTTAGVVEWRLYLDDSTSILETKTASSLVLGGANIDRLSFGHGASGAQTPFNGGTGYTDNVAASSTNWIGSAFVKPTLPVVVDTAVSQSAYN